MNFGSRHSILGMLVVLLASLTSCSSTYQITGNSDITSLDGKKLSLRTLENGQWVEMPSLCKITYEITDYEDITEEEAMRLIELKESERANKEEVK